MPPFSSKRPIFFLIVFVALIIGAGFLIVSNLPEAPVSEPVEEYTPEVTRELIGKSVEGRDIESYTIGRGNNHLLFVGGVHGGYEWNSVVLAYKFIDYLKSHPELITDNLTVSVIPNANPDGVFKVIGKEGKFSELDVTVNKEESKPGRFNANDVDLNRNFDCKWQPESTWQGNVVSAGTEAFSEPEARAIRDFVFEFEPNAVVFWHSQSNAVYASECEEGILPKTLEVMNAYSRATGYPAVDVFDAYEITGDAEGWLASIGIPAITVELETHETIEWERNLLGVRALFDLFE